MNKQFPNMYKRGSKGEILEWKVEIQNNNGKVDIFMSYGELNGNHTVKYQRDIEGKNIGKANETTAWEQATKDVEGKITRKRRDGYKTLEDLGYDNKSMYGETDMPTQKQMDSHSLLRVFLDKYLPRINTNLEGNLMPMKCQQYYRKKENWTAPDGTKWKDRKYFYLLNPNEPKEKGAIITKFPTIIQPKINGVRAFTQEVNGEFQLFSKKGLNYNLPHITKFLDTFAFECLNELIGENTLILDGELYLHRRPLADITSATKKVNLDTYNLTYVIFDIAIEGVKCIDRVKALGQMRKDLENISMSSPIQVIRSIKVSTDEQVQSYTDAFIKEGYEGSIQRDPDGLYAFGKRPQQITKLKRIMDEEFIILDVIPQEKNELLGLFVCKTKDGMEFKVTPNGTEDFKSYILFNKQEYVGKELTCWFYEYTPDGLPFHIIRNLVRDYE